MSSKKPIATQLQQNFVHNAQFMLSSSNENGLEHHPGSGDFNYRYRQEIDKGMRLGTFLYDCGWLEDSVTVLNATKTLISKLDGDYTKLLLQLDCYQKLLHVQASFCCYKEAAATTTITVNLIDRIQESHIDSKTFNSPSENILPDSLFANFYQNLSVLHFNRSEYDLSYSWSVKALKYLRSSTPAKISVDVLRQAAKSCVVKRKFQIANLLINSAVRVAE